VHFRVYSVPGMWQNARVKEDITLELWSIGHSNHPADKFVGLLKQHEITVLVDVRSSPRSRFPQFQRDNLIKLVTSNGLQYLYGGTILGGLSDRKVGDATFISKMDRMLELTSEGQRVAMMCSEGKPCECHRAGKLMAWLHRERIGVKTTHILPDGSLVDAREYEPKVEKHVRWPEFEPWVGSQKKLI